MPSTATQTQRAEKVTRFEAIQSALLTLPRLRLPAPSPEKKPCMNCSYGFSQSTSFFQGLFRILNAEEYRDLDALVMRLSGIKDLRRMLPEYGDSSARFSFCVEVDVFFVALKEILGDS